MYREIRHLRRSNEYRRIIIDEVNMGKGFITGRDAHDNPIRINIDLQAPIVAIPAPGEMWNAQRHENEWRLSARMETGSESKPLAALNPGDRRLEATNDLHVSGENINLDGTTNLNGIININGLNLENILEEIKPRIFEDGDFIGSESRIDFITNDDPSIAVIYDTINSKILINLGDLLPAGIIVPYAGTNAPLGWTFTLGQVVPIGTPGSVYYRVYEAIGTTWNIGGEGVGNFRLPDTQGYMLVGKAGAGGHADVTTLGATNMTTLANRRPAHSHSKGTIAISASGSHLHTFAGEAAVITGGAHGHIFTGTGGTTGAGTPHSHTYTDPGHTHGIGNAFGQSGADRFAPGPSTLTSSTSATIGITINNESVHTHSFTPVGTISNTDTHTHDYTPLGTISSDTHIHSTADFTGRIGTTTAAPEEASAYVVINYIIKL